MTSPARLRRIAGIFSLFALLTTPLFAQQDTVFWFVAPEVSQGNQNLDRPVAFRFSSYAQPAVVTISQPANPGFVPQTVTLAANASGQVQFPPDLNLVENSPPDQVLNKGFLIQSTAPVSAYYEVFGGQPQVNPELFTLKGRHALGTAFYVPFQTITANSDIHFPAPFSAFDIVATENNTTVTITPSQPIVGHADSIAFSIVLQRGQTYSATATGQFGGDHPAGSKVVADKPIAITIKDDLVVGDVLGGTCRDLLGDQLVPVNELGQRYILQRGFLDQDDRAFVVGTAPATTVSLDGIAMGTIGEGETLDLAIGDGAHLIEATAPVYVLHLTGTGCELADALLPRLDCAGSNAVRLIRSNETDFYLMLVTEIAHAGDFALNGNPALIPAGNFLPVPGTGGAFVAATLSFSDFILPSGASLEVTNSSGVFQLGVLHGDLIRGSRYTFFSDLGVQRQETYQLCVGDTLQVHGLTITEGGVYSANVAAQGCDTTFLVTVNAGTYINVEQTVELCPGETFTIDGLSYTAPATVIDTLDIPGCDSILTFHLELLLQPTLAQSVSFCPGDSVTIAGTVYTQPGTVLVTLPAVTGCDTLATYTLELLAQPTLAQTVSLCPGDSVTIGGTVYTQPGTVLVTLPAATGCDTLLTYTLEQLPQPTLTQTISFCPGDSVTIGGTVYTQPGTVQVTLPAATGCDTLATYTLELLAQPTLAQTIGFCPGDSVTIGGTVYTQPGTVQASLPATVGCDTLATYTLELLTQPTLAQTVSFCQGDSVTIGGTVYTQPGTVLVILPAATGCDTLATYTFVVAPQVELQQTLSACTGETITLNGIVYTAPAVVLDTLVSTTGCDTIVTYTLQFDPLAQVTQNLGFCQGDVFTLDGVNYTQDATVLDTLPALAGCDTVVTYVLTFAPLPTRTETVSRCEGEAFTLQGINYFQDTTLIDTVPATAGCDTVVTYQVTFDPLPTRTENPALCAGDVFTVNGVAYTQNATALDTLAAAVGCDTVVTYVLTFAPLPTRTETVNLCAGDVFTVNGVNYTQNATALDTLAATASCDTVVTYVLTFAPLPTRTETVNLCAGDVFTVNGVVYTQNATALDTLAAATGCDTVVTYVLTFAPLPNRTEVIELAAGDSVVLGGTAYFAPDTVLLTVLSTTGGCDTLVTYLLQPEPDDPCDVKTVGCLKFELLGIALDVQGNKIYRHRVTNSCAATMTYVAFQVPDGVEALAPANGSTYIAPSGRGYTVRNPNYSPFYSVRFKSQGAGIAGGQSDVFVYKLPEQADPLFINAMVRLSNGQSYEVHLNLFDCVIEPFMSFVKRPEEKFQSEPAPDRGATGVVPALMLYPNPTAGPLAADLSGWGDQEVRIEVYGTRGQKVLEQSVPPGTTSVRLELPPHLPSGLYLIEAKGAGGRHWNGKVVLQEN
jgi:hypothetical protein